MTGKPLPTHHSIFINDVFGPLRQQLAPAMPRMTGEAHGKWAREAAATVTKHYLSLIVVTIEKVANDENALLRRVALKKSPAASAVEPAGMGGVSDSHKIRMQLCLDVAAFGAELSAVGVEAESLTEFQELQDAVRPDASLLQASHSSALTAAWSAVDFPIGAVGDFLADGEVGAAAEGSLTETIAAGAAVEGEAAQAGEVAVGTPVEGSAAEGVGGCSVVGNGETTTDRTSEDCDA